MSLPLKLQRHERGHGLELVVEAGHAHAHLLRNRLNAQLLVNVLAQAVNGPDDRRLGTPSSRKVAQPIALIALQNVDPFGRQRPACYTLPS